MRLWDLRADSLLPLPQSEGRGEGIGDSGASSILHHRITMLFKLNIPEA